MKLNELLDSLHGSQRIKVYGDGNLLTTGHSNIIQDDSYLNSEVNYFFSESIDQISIEIL